jgi:hypothetical protein
MDPNHATLSASRQFHALVRSPSVPGRYRRPTIDYARLNSTHTPIPAKLPSRIRLWLSYSYDNFKSKKSLDTHHKMYGEGLFSQNPPVFQVRAREHALAIVTCMP